MKIFRHIPLFVSSLLALSVLTSGCVREQFDDIDRHTTRPSAPLNLDDISIFTSAGEVATDPNRLEYDVTVRYSNSPVTKSAVPDHDSVTVADVALTSYKRGRNPMMSDGGPATKSLYDQVTTRDLNSNFLRLDETVGTNDIATYEWQTWDNAFMLEANVIATPDNTDNLYYRTVTFNPGQAYNIRTFNEELVDGMWIPRDTIFYHTRMVAWYPMICTVPVGSAGDKAVIQFKDNRYVQYRKQISSTSYGVVFDHQLDGGTDVMMSNMCEAQRYHRNYDLNNNPTPHYRDLGKTLEEDQVNYRFPFGHNDNHPTYSNPMFYHHYLSAIRVWAKVDQSGDAAALNLLTWGQINAVSVVNQPSTVTIALPERASSAVTMDEYGNIVMQDGHIKFTQDDLVFGEVNEWSDYINMHLRTTLMFGEGDINHPDDQEVHYPIDMTKVTDIHGMDATYLGYCLIKPCDPWVNGEDDETITLAIQTQGGTYQAVIPCRAIVEDMETHSTEEVHVFDESQVYDIVLNLRTAGTFSDFLGEEDEDVYEDLSPYDETNGTFKTANSYIVPADSVAARIARGETLPGYTFVGNVIGNGDAGIIKTHGAQTFHTSSSIMTDATKAAVVWQSNEGQIANVQLLHGYVRFQMRNANPGNAVIAVTDDLGTVKWSWHIWIADNTPGKVTINNVEFMDRNLGALWHYSGSYPAEADRVNSYGLYYQWGRKDPIPAPATWNQTESTDISPIYDEYGARVIDLGAYVFDQCNTISDAIEHPMHYALSPFNQFYLHDWMSESLDFLWGETDATGITSKSIYDPCPFGYRIVHGELQDLMESSSTTVTASENNGLVVTNGGARLYLPYAGFFGPDRNYTSNTNSGYFMGTKGDYTCGLICPTEDAEANTYFADHRLRTYISQATSWTSENIDGVTSFTYNANNGKHYVQSDASVPSRRDYANRKTAGSVRCISDGSYVKMAFAHLTPITHTLIAGQKVRLDINAGVNLGAIKTAWLKASYTDDGGTHDQIVNFVSGGMYQTAEFLTPFNGTYNALTIKGTYDFQLPATLPSDKYTFTFFVEEMSGSTKEASCEVRTISVETISITTTMQSSPTDGVHPYAGQNFTVTATIKAGPGSSITVARNDFKINGNAFTAASATAPTPDADGFTTVTVTFNNVHLDEPGLNIPLNLSGKVTIDGISYDWSDGIVTEVWEKVGEDRVDTSNPYTTLAAAASATDYIALRSNSSTYLYNNDGTPAVTANTNFVYDPDYCWTISSSGAIRNAGNESYLSVNNGSVSFSTSSLDHTFTSVGTNRFYIIRNGRYMRSNLATRTSTNNDCRWYLYPVTLASYVDPHIDAGTLALSGSGLHDGHPVTGTAFSAGYSVTVHDADALTVTSAKIGGVTTTATVTPSGEDFIVTLAPVSLTFDEWKNTEVPVKIDFKITSAELGLDNSTVKQTYSPTVAVYKYVTAGRYVGERLTTLADVIAETNGVLMVNKDYDTDDGKRFTCNDGNNLSSTTTLSRTGTTANTTLWKVSGTANGSYSLQSVGNSRYLLLNATRNYGWTYSTPSLNSTNQNNLSISVNSSGDFTISRIVTSGSNTTTCYFRQSGNTTFNGNSTTSTWHFYTYEDYATDQYAAPIE